jgi:hypothetical protein
VRDGGGQALSGGGHGSSFTGGALPLCHHCGPSHPPVPTADRWAGDRPPRDVTNGRRVRSQPGVRGDPPGRGRVRSGFAPVGGSTRPARAGAVR